MLVPDIAYAFTRPTDTAGPTFEILSRQQQLSTAAILVELFLTDIPKDRVLVLSNVAMRADPGSGQGVDELVIQGVTQAGLIFDIKTQFIDGANNIRFNLDWQGEVFIQGAGAGNTTLRAFALFSAGAAANLFQASFHGVIIPHGNVGAF